MAQTTLPPGRVGHDEQVRAYTVDALVEAGGAEQIGAAVAFLVNNKTRLAARNAMKEASARLYAASNFR